MLGGAAAHNPLQALCDAAIAALGVAVDRLAGLLNHDNPAIVLRAAHTLARIASLNRRLAPNPASGRAPAPPDQNRSPRDPHADLLRVLAELGELAASPPPPVSPPHHAATTTPALARSNRPEPAPSQALGHPAAPTARAPLDPAPVASVLPAAPPSPARVAAPPTSASLSPAPLRGANLTRQAWEEHPPWSPADSASPADPVSLAGQPPPRRPPKPSNPTRRSPHALIIASGGR